MMRSLLILLTSLSFSAASAMVVHSKGVAKNKDGKIMYIEKHASTIKDGRVKAIETRYFKDAKESESYGSIDTDFSENPYVPNFEFQDTRLGRYVKVKNKDGRVYAEARPKKGDDVLKSEFDRTDKMVAGQGFYNMIMIHAEQFKDPNFQKNVRLLVPLKEDWYTFRMKAESYNPKTEEIVIRLEASSWLFRIFAPSIDVTFDLKNNRLVRYKGPSNLVGLDGQVVDVTIDYVYPDKVAAL